MCGVVLQRSRSASDTGRANLTRQDKQSEQNKQGYFYMTTIFFNVMTKVHCIYLTLVVHFYMKVKARLLIHEPTMNSLGARTQKGSKIYPGAGPDGVLSNRQFSEFCFSKFIYLIAGSGVGLPYPSL